MILQELRNEILKIGKEKWQSMLVHAAELHVAGIHPPFFKLPYQWEEIAPQTENGLIFGNWETVHIALDTLLLEPRHAIRQILNCLALQQTDGLIPGHLALINNQFRWSGYTTFPPLWPHVVQEYYHLKQDREILRHCFYALHKQIQWFENNRRCGEGFYYVDRLDRFWESGVEEGVRFDLGSDEDDQRVCVDATSHMYNLYKHACVWAKILDMPSTKWQHHADELKRFIQDNLFDEETGFFHDLWAVDNPQQRILAFEGIWPLVCGAATPEQASRVINENILDRHRFFTEHPIPSVAINDPHFDYCRWRGPTHNSMTYWAALGCLNYGRTDGAWRLLERALDLTADHFTATQKIWEFYHPEGNRPSTLTRFVDHYNMPPKADCLGHNPLIAMALLWKKIAPKQ